MYRNLHNNTTQNRYTPRKSLHTTKAKKEQITANNPNIPEITKQMKNMVEKESNKAKKDTTRAEAQTKRRELVHKLTQQEKITKLSTQTMKEYITTDQKYNPNQNYCHITLHNPQQTGETGTQIHPGENTGKEKWQITIQQIKQTDVPETYTINIPPQISHQKGFTKHKRKGHNVPNYITINQRIHPTIVTLYFIQLAMLHSSPHRIKWNEIKHQQLQNFK